MLQLNKEWREAKKEHLIKYRLSRRKVMNEYMRDYRKTKSVLDINFKIRDSIRRRLNQSLHKKKTHTIVKYLGCSIDELKCHLETKFTKDMNWTNYGLWHIDHIKPLASFDLTDEQQIYLACNYNNLQPLWAKDNLSKGKKNESKSPQV